MALWLNTMLYVFEELCTRVLGIPGYFILEMYISGLKEDIQTEVLRDKPNDIHEAFELSLIVESRISGFKGVGYKPYTLKSPKLISFSPKADLTDSTTKEAVSSTLVFKRFTPAERKERTTKGLCFNCDDKFIPGHKCKGRIFRLSADQSCFWEIEKENEVEAEIEESEEEENIQIIQGDQTEISLCAFEGHINSNTIRSDRFIKCQCISVLVDTGSIHNFMQVEVANALKLIIHVIVPFKVSTGSGEKLTCDRVCKNVEIKIQDITVRMNIFLLPMAGSNMVIGPKV